jgi:hypothetical protein
MMFAFACALMGCGSDSGSDNTVINGLVGLAADDGAALAGLTFDFPDATIFGFPGASATLGVGDGATTFTLTNGDTGKVGLIFRPDLGIMREEAKS